MELDDSGAAIVQNTDHVFMKCSRTSLLLYYLSLAFGALDLEHIGQHMHRSFCVFLLLADTTFRWKCSMMHKGY